MVCPLSLQDLCLLCVINSVDSYPVELLATLPRWLRNQLLHSLPVLDLCHLDCTPVARGVDTNTIWTAKLKRDQHKATTNCIITELSLVYAHN